MLASPIATTLKLNYPAAKLTYWTHPALKNILLELCPSIDEVIDYDRDLGIFQLAKNFNKLGADLFVDLANSFKSQAMTWMTKSTVLRYQKQAADIEPRQHAVGNFMETIRPVCQEIPEQLFPSIFPAALSEQLLARIFSDQNFPALPLIGLVPGVGKLRPHRAWLFEGWLYLLRHILENGNYLPVLIGGEDEIELSEKLNQELDNSCMNACGQLSLTETAALLKACKVVIAGDTGPAHMAVAVGTPVIGLYGPTYPERSGPYGYQNYVLSQSADCDCHALKICRYANPNEPGRCMQRIMLAEVLEKLAVFGL